MKKTIPHFSFFTYRIKIIFPPKNIYHNSKMEIVSINQSSAQIFQLLVLLTQKYPFRQLYLKGYQMYRKIKSFPEMPDFLFFFMPFLALLPVSLFKPKVYQAFSHAFPPCSFSPSFSLTLLSNKKTRGKSDGESDFLSC